LVILDLAKGDYFGIDEIGARLWRGLERGQSCEEIAGALIVDYDTDRERLLTDLLNLANELLVKGLVELAMKPDSSVSAGSKMLARFLLTHEAKRIVYRCAKSGCSDTDIARNSPTCGPNELLLAFEQRP